MQEKLLIGGQMLDMAKMQEMELRQAQIELEERRRQELELARNLAERFSSKANDFFLAVYSLFLNLC